MLSRVAESVHWMARYVERAEDMTRVLAVQCLALLDAPRGFPERSFEGLLRYLGEREAFDAIFPQPDAASVTEFFVSHPGNPSSVVSSIQRARENARAAREQISSEMWEHLNRLYFDVKDVGPDAFARGPYDFYRRIRDGSQAFQGVTDATLTQGEAFWFIEMGKLLERASQVLRTLAVRYEAKDAPADGTPEGTLELITVLKACSAFEPFRQSQAQLTSAAVVEFLLQHRRLPRAVLFCVTGAAAALDRITELAAAGALRPDRPRQLLGRLCADLEYLEAHETLAAGIAPFLDATLRRVHAVADEVARTYFSTRVVTALGQGLQAGPQEQQQQQ